MKLYRVDAHGKIKWVGSQAATAKARKEFTDVGVKRNEITTTEIDVPTRKVELLDWLNEQEEQVQVRRGDV